MTGASIFVMPEEFLLRVRGAQETRVFRFSGAEAADLHRLLQSGHFERPGGTQRLTELIRGRSADHTLPGANSPDGPEAHFDMVDDDQLRGYLSQRLLERKGAAEGGGGSQGARYIPNPPRENTP